MKVSLWQKRRRNIYELFEGDRSLNSLALSGNLRILQRSMHGAHGKF
jgi:hypothetical protein